MEQADARLKEAEQKAQLEQEGPFFGGRAVQLATTSARLVN